MAANEAGFWEVAIELANQSQCDPKTLNRTARDFIDTNPVFALEAGGGCPAVARKRLFLRGQRG